MLRPRLAVLLALLVPAASALMACEEAARAPALGAEPAADPRFVGPGLRGAAFPHWPMFHHDAQHTGRNPVAPAASPAVLWTFLTEGGIWSSPAIGLDGTVYVE